MAHQPLDPFAAPQSQAAYFKAIADGVDLPLVAYVRSDAMSLTDILGVANHPNVAGVKFATTNLMLLSECIRASGPATAPLGVRPRRGLGRAVLRRRRARLHVGARQCRSRPLARHPRRARGGLFRPRARPRRHHRPLRDDAHALRQRRQRHGRQGSHGADRLPSRPRAPAGPARARRRRPRDAGRRSCGAGACCRAAPRRSKTARCPSNASSRRAGRAGLCGSPGCGVKVRTRTRTRQTSNGNAS